MSCFIHQDTDQVVELSQIVPDLYNCLGIPTTLQSMNAKGWWLIKDPGYRGMPRASTKDLTRPGADLPQTDEQTTI